MLKRTKDSELIVLTKDNKNYSYLQLKIQEVLRRRKMSFKEFTRLLREAVDIDQIEFLRLRNKLTNDIFNTKHLSYFSFEFLATKVLNEPELLDDPEVILINKLGPKGLDLRNKKFGSLTAIELVDTPKYALSKNNHWRCECDCGNEIITNTANLGSGQTTSCGKCIDNSTMISMITDDKEPTVLRRYIWDSLRKTQMTQRRFEILYNKAMADKITDKNKLYKRMCNTKYAIVGTRGMSVDLFRFIMTEILNEPLPDDPEITMLEKIGYLGVNIIGERRGSLVVKDHHRNVKGINSWVCECDCGNMVITTTGHLNSGHTQSCGCYLIDKISTHSMCNSPEYSSWESMKARCNNTNNSQYYNYGGRGISVCDRWINSFGNFYEDMGPRPEGMSIERIDVNGNYEPDNCKWATNIEQGNNRRNTIVLDNGIPLSIWVRDNSLCYKTVRKHFRNGLSTGEILKRLKR